VAGLSLAVICGSERRVKQQKFTTTTSRAEVVTVVVVVVALLHCVKVKLRESGWASVLRYYR
jgi:predicted membrane chloride channel (bestrophin family)